MKRTEGDQARRIMACVDDAILRRRIADGGTEPLSPQDLELDRLSALAQCLSEIEVVPPDGFQEQVLHRLREPAAAESQPERWRATMWHAGGALAAALRVRSRATVGRTAALTAVVLAGVFLVGRSFFDIPVVSAQTVLTRSDAALIGLVRPGQVLYRQWKVSSSSTPAGAGSATRSGRIIEEWMDGSDPERVAARWYSEDRRLQIAYTTKREGGEHRAYVYFSPGVFDEQRGVLNIEPTAREFDDALGGFPASARRGLRVYLDRHYIYAPITGESTFNRAIVQALAHNVPEMPRVLMSFDRSHVLNTTPVYRVSLLDSASVTFNWRSSGPPLIRLARAEIIRYISRDSFLGLRTEERYVFEDGRRRFTIRELVTTNALAADELTVDPFTIDVPRGTPVHHQSALEHLSGVADVLERVPAFTSRFAGDSSAAIPDSR